MELEYKSINGSKGIVDIDEEHGIITAIVAVTGIEDAVKDIIEPGAFTKSMAKRTPKGVWSHDWKIPVSKTLEMKELLPGDPDLPRTLANGDPWPASAGAVQVKQQFNLGTSEGRSAFSNVTFYEDEQEWSIGYQAAQSYKDARGTRHLKELEWYEYSPVLFGAMTNARSVKELAHDQLISMKSILGNDVFYKELGSIVEDDYDGDEDDEDEEDDEDLGEFYDDWDDEEGEEKSLGGIMNSLENSGFSDIVELKTAVGALATASRNGDLALTNEYAEEVLDIIEDSMQNSDTYTVDLVQLAQQTAELSREAEVVRFYDAEDDEDDEDDYDDWDDEDDLVDEYDDDEDFEDEDDEDLEDEITDEDAEALVSEIDEDVELTYVPGPDGEEKAFLRVGEAEFKDLLLNM